MRFFFLGFAVLVSAASVRAESPAPQCGGWWEVNADIPLHVAEASKRPYILLPVRKSAMRWGGWGESPMEASTLGVEVVGASGHRPAGAVEEFQLTESGVRVVSGIMRWRALEDLHVGERYTLELTVADSPPSWGSIQCPIQQGFSQTITFDVVETPPESPQLDVSVTALAGMPFLLFNRCDEGPGTLLCAEPPDVCCGYDQRWTTQTTFSARGPMPPPAYVVFELRYRRHLWTSRDYVVWRQLAAPSEPAVDGATHGADATLQPELLCVTVHVRSLMRDLGDELATVVACPDLTGYVPPVAPVRNACPIGECAQNAHMSQIGDHVEVADPGAEVADPKWDSSPGCGGGAGASWLGFAVLVGAGLRRSGASRTRRVDHA